MTMCRPVAIFAAMTLAASLAASPAPAQSKAEALIDQGFKLIQKQRFAPALKKLEKALESGAGDVFEAHLGIAIACGALAELDRAVEHARRATELAASPQQSVYAYNQLGVASFHHLQSEIRRKLADRGPPRAGAGDRPLAARDWSVAENAFRQVLELDPERFPIARLSLAQVLGHQRRYDEALAELEAWEGTNPPAQPPDVRKTIANLRCQAAAGRRNPDGRLLEIGPGIVKPQRRSYPAPKYTETALAAGAEGLVALEAVIDRDGRVICTEVVSGLPHGLSESAEQAVRAWQYEPAMRDSEPVAVILYPVVTFRLADIR